MNTCKTCKWWTAPNERQQHSISSFRECENPLLNQYGFAENAGGFSGADTIPGTSNQACPGAGDPNGGVWFSTGPDFGCIHHEEKS